MDLPLSIALGKVLRDVRRVRMTLIRSPSSVYWYAGISGHIWHNSLSGVKLTAEVYFNDLWRREEIIRGKEFFGPLRVSENQTLNIDSLPMAFFAFHHLRAICLEKM